MTTGSVTPNWVTSSYSGNGGSCVEWAPNTARATGSVPVRDSKNTSGPVIVVPAAAFTAFVTGLKSHELNR